MVLVKMSDVYISCMDHQTDMTMLSLLVFADDVRDQTASVLEKAVIKLIRDFPLKVVVQASIPGEEAK